MGKLVYSPCSLGVKAQRKAIITPDEHGYRPVILGALNVFNSQGHYYTLEKSKEIFEKDSNAFFMNLLRNGQLFSEYGHPNRQEGQSVEEYLARLAIVREDRVCSHIKDIWLDDDYSKYTSTPLAKDTVVIMGSVAPYGNLKQVSEDGFKNPNINTAYSVRGITVNEVIAGVLHRYFTNINTFDLVFSPGISVASDWNLPKEAAKESLTHTRTLADETFEITPAVIDAAKESVMKMGVGSAMESDSIRFLDALESNYQLTGSLSQARKSSLYNW